MSEQAAPEPTMEEILASIRRIISEDEAPAADTTPAEPEPEPVAAAQPAPIPEPEPEAEPAEDVLELTERVDSSSEGVGDIEPFAPESAPAPSPMIAPAEEESLVSPPTSFAAASEFGRLSAAIAMPPSGRTLEDVVRELLRPLLKEWLDEHLPRIVETKVAEEVERIARRVR